ncbi:type VII secretion-associated serine protease mycosin [Alloactinosynnema sp. L-07]|uniref:type VII secretion-associated serine protease mycosin n=1 Tax=Alloactinosynnema sp. L-07 TaxID=1653480 RepID=UPI0012FBB593|nr:type VII secretion-associated serine protease mycosin [Alloactinosynnema sp. L-07]
MRRHLVPAVVAAVLPLLGAAPAAAAPPPEACHNPDPARPQVRERPWAQQVLAPESVWPHSTGAGVTVAVVDSGVDADHPQLRGGKVLPGRDFFRPGGGPATFDCVSHGTGVAGVIAAEPLPGVGFHGIAPAARILPVRVSDREVGDNGVSTRVDPRVLAEGIRYAADQGAKVINLSIAGYEDFPELRDAVAHAVAKDALVVAAAGNGQPDDSTELPSFPAAYDGVLGVGAVGVDGARLSRSQIGRYVDITAPGESVLATTRIDGHTVRDGTSFATPFVAATAALVRSVWPRLTAREVAQRLMATASPARGGLGSPAYGAGLVNPYRAVVDGLTPTAPAKLAPAVDVPEDQAQLDAVAGRERIGATAKTMTAVVAGGIVLAVLVAAVRPRGKRRRWRAGWAAAVPVEPAVVEPPEEIFLIKSQE